MAGTYDKQIWEFLYNKIGNEYGVAGLMGNLYHESALKPNNLENSYETSLGYTDESYTEAVNNGTYSKDSFIHDGAGYGLAQWTYYTRKQALYNMYKVGGYDSIGNINLALNYLWYELQNDFAGVLSVLKSATSVRQASDKVLHDFENPADQSESVEILRANKGQEYFDTYNGSATTNQEIIDSAVAWAIQIANDDAHGYDQAHREGPDYDCSSLCINAYQQAGIDVKGAGAGYTGNMRQAFVACGFKAIPYTTNETLVKGDLILNEGNHVVIYIGNNQVVNASINENGEVSGGQTGDQTGKEIYIRSMYQYSSGWDYILRLPSSYVPDSPSEERPSIPTKKLSKFLLLAVASD